MTTFYDFLKAETEKANGFEAFSYQAKNADGSCLTQSQFSAFQSADAMQISRQILLEHDNYPHDAALTITLAITTTITIDTLR